MRDKFRHYIVEDEHEAGYNLSWGAVIAGIVTFLALFIVFSTIGSALGLGIIDFTSSNPFSGLGTTAIIWAVVTALVSFFGAGFVSGVASRRLGLLHGFLTWASNLIVLVIFISMILSSLLSLTGRAIGGAANVAGDAIGAGAGAATTAVTEGFDLLSENLNVDQAEMEQQTVEILEGTGIEELQPDYLTNQLDDARQDIQEAGKEVITNPDNADQIISDLGDQLSSRVENVSQEVDQEAISNSIAENTDLTGPEAEEAAQNIVDGIEQTNQTAQEGLNSAVEALNQVPEEIDSAIQTLQQTAEEATTVSAWSLFGLFIGHILLAVVSALGGRVGARLTKRSPEEHRA